VPEHPVTKSAADLKSAPSTNTNTIFVKLRQFGRSNNRRVIGSIPPTALRNSREPVSLGEVEGAMYPSISFPESKTSHAKSSRRGNEHMRPKTSGGRPRVDSRRSDLIVGDNPWNGTRET